MRKLIDKRLINETEASERYGYSRQWFQRERWKGTGPRFIKINNGRVLYPLKETDNWFEAGGQKGDGFSTEGDLS